MGTVTGEKRKEEGHYCRRMCNGRGDASARRRPRPCPWLPSPLLELQ